MDKNKAWRQRCKENGKCTRCGKPSFPYHDCAECRFKLKIARICRKLHKCGVFVKDSEGRYNLANQNIPIPSNYEIREDDARKLPRYKNRPLTPSYIREIVRGIGKPITEDEFRKYLLAAKKVA